MNRILLLAVFGIFIPLSTFSQQQNNYGNNNINIQKVVGPVTIQNSPITHTDQCLLKIYCNTKAILNIDGDSIGIVEVNKPFKKLLSAGQYQFKFEGVAYSDEIINKDITITRDMLDFENTLSINFKIDGDLVPVRNSANGKFCYLNYKTLELPLLKRYKEAHAFVDGLALVSENNKFGFIDYTGKEVVPIKYESATEFLNGYSLVSINHQYGMVDISGKMVVPCVYNNLDPFVDDLSKAESSTGEVGFINKLGDTIIPFKYSDAKAFEGKYAIVGKGGITVYDRKCCSQWGVIDKSGKEIISSNYDKITHASTNVYNHEIFAVQQGDKWKFFDEKGNKEFIFSHYDEIKLQNSGFFIIKKKGKYGYLTNSGVEILPPEYDSIACFDNGYAAVYKNGLTGIAGPHYHDVSDIKYNCVYSFNGYLGVVSLNGKCAYVNEYKKEITPFIYDYTNCPLANGYFFDAQIVKLGNKYGLIDYTGKEIVAPIYDSIILNHLEAYHNGVRFSDGTGYEIAIVKKDGKYGLMALNGVSLTKIIYDGIEQLNDSLFKVTNSLYRTAIINKKGEVLFGYSFKNKQVLKKGIVEIEYDGAISYYLINGKCIFNCGN